MNLTLAMPSLNRADDEDVPALSLEALDFLLSRGNLVCRPLVPSEFYGRYLWGGSMLDRVKAYAGIPQQQAAVLLAPLWQQMGMNSINVVDGAYIGLEMDEAVDWCAGLSDFYADKGWRFAAVLPSVWLLLLPEPSVLATAPVLDVCGQRAYVPEGGADGWLAVQTEIQMWLHTHARNLIREKEGKPSVNGVWFWNDMQGSGNGALRMSDCIWGRFDSALHPAPYDFESWRRLCAESEASGEESVVFLDDLAVTEQCGDVWGYRDILQDWEGRWFAPAKEALLSGRLKSLRLATDGVCGGVLEILPRSRWAFWKKRKTFQGRWIVDKDRV